MELTQQYIVDEHNQRIAVQVDIQTFERIEETLENYALYEIMQDEDELLELKQAKDYYIKFSAPIFPGIKSRIVLPALEKHCAE